MSRFEEFLMCAFKITSTSKIVVIVAKGVIKGEHSPLVEKSSWFLITIKDAFTNRVYSYFFNDAMSDNELEDTYDEFTKKLSLLRNLNS